MVLRQNASDEIKLSDPYIALDIRLWPSFALAVLLTTHAASHLIRFSLANLSFNSVLNRLVSESTYFLYKSWKLFVILSN